ncbi:uncharacterized protein LOC18030404 [Eutrema salsugineum]|uniref:uncharacterized protein LOC18030404 n=1 Tax=Eutrema salsugineum TaxID=72664 RepID=UPI000CED3080|nr:uncharacterized protein LOC18030404 [Eutrema salsugineum]
MEDGEPSNTGIEDGEASNNLSEKLPKRVLGDGCYTVGAQLNIYSKANVIGLLVEALKGTEDLQKLLHSQFGKLFHLPVARCCNSAKLVHALLSRQLVTTKKHEIWFLFGGQPLRYSIREFKEITGLNCNPEPDSTEKEEDVGKTGIWKDLFGRAKAMNVFDVLEMLKDPDLPRWKRLPLALIVLVDGVLFCNSKNLALTEKHIEMLTDLDRFMLYPWGRVSFNKTVSRFQAPKAITDAEKRENPVTRLRRQLKQKTSACYGFPLSLQLMALQCIPMLISKIPQPDNLKTFLKDPEGCQNVITLLHLGDIHAVESDPLLSVKQMVLDDGENDQQNELRWGDEVEDAEVAFMQELMAEGYKFTPSDFAVAPAPIVDISDAEDEFTNAQEPEPSTIPKKKQKTHQTEKRPMQRKRGRGKNSSNLSEDESPEKDEEDDDVHQSKEEGEQDDEGQHTKKDGSKPDEDADEAEDGGEEGGYDGAQSSVRHNDGVHPEDGVHQKERDDEEGTSTYYGRDHYSPRDHAYLKTPGAPTMIPEPGQANSGTTRPPPYFVIPDEDPPSGLNEVDGGRTNLVSGPLVVYKPQTPHPLCYAYKKHEAQTDAQDAEVVANEDDSLAGKDYHTAPEPPQEVEGSSGVKALFVSRSKAAYKPLETVEQDHFKAFHELLSRERNIDFCIVTGHTVNNQFFLQIVKPTEWVNTMHMQVIMAMLWRRRGEIYLKDRVAFVDTLFISIIGNYYNDFISRDRNQYDWGKTIQGIVLGKPAKWANQRQRQMFIRFVDVVYVPMNWGSEHWVGLVIDFKTGNIKILDSFISHNDEAAVEQYMAPVCQSMPFILKRYLDSKLTEDLRTTPYTWSRLEGIYQNKISGDCGSCAAKFLEMHAAGLGVEDMALITDNDVDRLWKKYAIDSYEEFVGNPAIANA